MRLTPTILAVPFNVTVVSLLPRALPPHRIVQVDIDATVTGCAVDHCGMSPGRLPNAAPSG